MGSLQQDRHRCRCGGVRAIECGRVCFREITYRAAFSRCFGASIIDFSAAGGILMALWRSGSGDWDVSVVNHIIQYA